MTESVFYTSVTQASASDEEVAARRFVADVQRQFPGEQIYVPAYGSVFPNHMDAQGHPHPVSTTGALSRLFGNTSSGPASIGASCPPTPDYNFNVYGIVNYTNDGTGGSGAVASTTIQPHTYVGERDEYCKLTLYEIVWQTTSSTIGYYNIYVESYYANTNNPIVAFAAIPANAGHYKTASCIQGTVYYEDSWPQSLTRTALTQVPDGTDVQINPIYNSSNSLSWLFFWEARLDQVQQSWAAAGFNTFFNAGYDPNDAGVAEFDHNDHGNGCASSVIRFGPSDKWDGWTADHEAGHYWQYQKQGKTLPGTTAQVHSICNSYDATTAFIEGFADWHANQFSSVSERASYGFITTGGEVSQPQACDVTHYAEAGVADFFWDYFDSVNSATYDSSLDTVAFGSSLPYLKSNWPGTETSFSGWYNDMLNQGKFGSQAAAVLSLANHFTLF